MKQSKQLLIVLIACVMTGLVSTYGITSATVPKVNELISISSASVKGSASSTQQSVSADGRYVVFRSASSNLVSGDTNGSSDVFLRDRSTGTTSLVSVSSNGTQANYGGDSPSISYDGRYVVFTTNATNLDTSDTYPGADIYLRDIINGTTTLISKVANNPDNNAVIGKISADGRFVVYQSKNPNTIYQDIYVADLNDNSITLVSKDANNNNGNNSSEAPSISCDGGIIAFSSRATNFVSGDTNNSADVFTVERIGGNIISNLSIGGNNHSVAGTSAVSCDGNYITFQSDATNLVSGDTNSSKDVFRYSRVNKQTELISKSTSSALGNGNSVEASISGDGRYIAYSSGSTNLVASDTNGTEDIFIRDTKTGTTELLSQNSTGTYGNFGSYAPVISADGKYAVYYTAATNLVSGDTDNTADILISETGY